MSDVADYNKEAWNQQVERGCRWSVPVSSEAVALARTGVVEVVLTPRRKVPADWLGQLKGREVLCLASAGGQQGPLLAAAGARVTVFDNSPGQLRQDHEVAEREGLDLRLEEGDMRDLSRFKDESFDLIFHPVSNCFIPDLEPLWRESARVLRPGGELLAGFANPLMYMFDYPALERGEFQVRHRLPYSDLNNPEEAERLRAAGDPLEFGHLLQDQIGGQLRAGLILLDLFEDYGNTALAKYCPAFMATRARKLSV